MRNIPRRKADAVALQLRGWFGSRASRPHPFIPAHFYLVSAIVCVALFWVASRSNSLPFTSSNSSEAEADLIDQRLQRAAIAALGDRRGTVIIMDAQTGRVRAVVNPEIAFEENLPLGSTIKPFTALAALRAGVINEDSTSVCHETYSHDQFHTTCSHPRDLPPLNPTEAIAYSCNYYFAKVGEHLSEKDFTGTLDEFGFGRPTGVNVTHEVSSVFLRHDWKPENAIGEGDYLRTTPIQLLNAYTALINGGHLFTPQIARSAGFVPAVRSRVSIDADERTLIVKGMRGAVRYGTAESARLFSLPLNIFGKTGTATEIDGFRSQGWFIGFASASDTESADVLPDDVQLAVLVFLARAHGSEAAEASRPIFQEYARANEKRETTHGEQKIPATSNVAAGTRQLNSATVRVHLTRENVDRTMSIEDYVRGVVAAEGSMEHEAEALKALAVASRTFVIKNLGRHSADGYDFCTTTHCQRFTEEVPAEIAAAVDATRGEILSDSSNQVVDSYFSASCGGVTANIATLWGKPGTPYLRGVPDPYCEGEAHHNWIDKISQADLLRALQSDPRTNIGNRLTNVNVLRTDATGRAETIAIDGERRITVSGWDFKIIVGRVLGWNLLKSSRFQIARSGNEYIFRGSGFGHGLGLCQEGAHVMAELGADYREILAKYFPSTHISESDHYSADLFWISAPLTNRGSSQTVRRTITGENIRISYPQNLPERKVVAFMKLLEVQRESLQSHIASAGLSFQFPQLEIFLNDTTGNFVGRTGQPPWAAAATKGNRIEFQPLDVLQRRGILETTVRHEFVHRIVDGVGNGRAPRWLAEGLALNLAGEGRLLARFQPRTRMSHDDIERQLSGTPSSANEMRAVYAAAYNEVKQLINREGETKVWQRVATGY